jgi:hypothetical protein
MMLPQTIAPESTGVNHRLDTERGPQRELSLRGISSAEPIADAVQKWAGHDHVETVK